MKLYSLMIASLLFSLIILAVSLLYISDTLLSQSFSSLDYQAGHNAVETAEQLLYEEMSYLHRNTIDYAQWDDTYVFMQGFSQEFIDRSLQDSALETLNVDYVVFYDTNGRVYYSKGIGDVPRELLRLVPHQPGMINGSNKGFITSSKCLLIFASEPIVKSDGTGPAAGTLLFARCIGQEEEQKITSLLESSEFSMQAVAGASGGFAEAMEQMPEGHYTVYIEGRKVESYTVLKDVFGESAVIIRAITPAYGQAKLGEVRHYLFVSLLVVMFVLLQAIGYVMNNYLVQPLSLLSKSLSEIRAGDRSRRLDISGPDEIRELAKGINETLDEIYNKEEELRKSSVRYSTLLSSIPDIVLVHHKGIVLYINKQVHDVLGYRAEEVLGNSILNFVDEASRNKLIDIMRRRESGEVIPMYEILLRAKDGSLRHALVSTAQMEYEGKPCVLAIVHDITKRRELQKKVAEAEERYTSLFNESADPIVYIDISGQITDANFAALRMLDADGGLMGKNVAKLLANDAAAAIKAALAKGSGQFSFDVRLNCADGSAHDFIVKGKVDERDGAVAGAFLVMHDVTEIRKAEQIIKSYAEKLEKEVAQRTAELQREKRKVEELSQVKDEFIRNITHELRTPLSVIASNIFLLRDMAPMGREREWAPIIDMMKRNTERLENSINEILELSKISVEELQKERVYVKELATKMYEHYLPITKIKGIELKLSAEPVVIMANKRLLELVLSNLISNAVKFTKKGGVYVDVKGDADGAHITVRDTGIGISKENLGRLFNKFFKVDPNSPGTGIGLLITKQIIEKHGGTISIRSVLGEGTTVEVFLPRGADVEARSGENDEKGRNNRR